MTNLDLTTVRIQTKDVKRLDSLKSVKSESRWGVIERALDSLQRVKE